MKAKAIQASSFPQPPRELLQFFQCPEGGEGTERCALSTGVEHRGYLVIQRGEEEDNTGSSNWVLQWSPD